MFMEKFREVEGGRYYHELTDGWQREFWARSVSGWEASEAV